MKPIRSILLTVFLTIAAFTAVVYTACKKDHCNNVLCLNGGACDGGNCVCLQGYEGDRCQTLSREKFIFTFNGGDTCSNGDSIYNQYPISFLAIASNPVEMNMKNILNNSQDSAVCTMQTADSFTFIGSNNSTVYSGTGTLNNDTLRLYYQVQQDTFSYKCAYVGSIAL
jgi:hypothetical protein